MDIGKMMRQAQEMQSKMGQIQKQLETEEVIGTAGGDLVSVTTTGKGQAKKINIDPSLINPTEKEMLEDLIIAAMNNARQKADDRADELMKEATGGLSLPSGMKLPF